MYEKKAAILYIGNFCLSELNASGKRVLANALLLKNIGYEVVFIGFGKQGVKNECIKSICNNEFISYTFLYSNDIFRMMAYNRYKRCKVIFNEVKEKYVIKAIIMYGSMANAIYNLYVAKWCKNNGIKVIYDHVDIFSHPDKKNVIKYFIKKIDYEILYKLVFNKCDGIIAISSYIKEYHKKNNRLLCIVIPPLVYKTKKSRQRKSNEEYIIITYAGTITDVNRDPRLWKDRIDLMIDAILYVFNNSNIKIKFYLIGFNKEELIAMFPRKMRSEYEKKISELKEVIEFLGEKKQLEVEDYLIESDFSFLIRDENQTTMAGFPTKVSESISCGLPVILNNTSDIKKYIIQGINGFIIPKEEAGLYLLRILSMNKKNIDELKKSTYECKTFYYMNYLLPMKSFLENEVKV
jgi:glycosyltransferase involved in cell wall biosynthesis